MHYLQRYLYTLGIGTAILLNHSTSAQAENLSLSNMPENRNSAKQLLQPQRANKNFSLAFLPISTQINLSNAKYFLNTSDWSFSAVSKISQLTPISPEDTPENDQTKLPAIINLDAFITNDQPLLLPTKPEQVIINIEKPITLKQAVSLALTNNKEVEISRLNINRSLAELQEAKAALYPNLSASTGFDNRQLAGGTGGFTGATSESFSAPPEESATAVSTTTNTFDSSLSLSYDIYTGGSRGASIRSAEKQVRLNQLSLEQTMEETRLQLATDYYNLQSSEAQVEIEQAAVKDAQQTLNDAELLEKAGTGTEFEMLQAQVELAQAQQTLNLEQANRDIAQRQLADTLNVGQKVEIQTADEVKPVGLWNSSLPKSIILAYKNRAELKQFLLEREINAEERRIARAENLPQVSLVASYDLQDELDDNTDLADGYSIGASVDWALLDGGAASARARQSETDIEIDEAEFANQRDTIRFEVEDAYYSLNANQENINTATQSVQLAQESLRLARLRFQAGAGTQTDVIVAQSELATARGNLLNAIIDYNQSFAELRRAITNLPES